MIIYDCRTMQFIHFFNAISLPFETEIRQETGVSDIVNAIRMAKHRWASHITRLPDNRWTIGATEWTPRDWTRKQGRPKTRWRDDFTKQLGPAWSSLAKDRYLWDHSREVDNGDDADDFTSQLTQRTGYCYK